MSITFENPEFQLQVRPDGDSFRVEAPGLAKSLGFREAYDLVRSIPEGEKGSETVRTPGGEQQVWYVTEPGFYRAVGQRQIARIKDPSAREMVARFQSWVYGTVLPEIRRSGSYQGTPFGLGAAIAARPSEAEFNEHILPAAARAMSYARWLNPQQGIAAFIQLQFDLGLVPSPADDDPREITSGETDTDE